MNDYEITYLVDPNVAEDKRGELNGTVDAAITDMGGDISYNTESVRRRLAYPIADQRVGFARTVQAMIDPAKIAELKATVAKLDGVMRLTVLQTAKRDEVTPAIFEAATAKQQVAPKKTEAAAKPAGREVTMEEVEEKIEKALDEEVK